MALKKLMLRKKIDEVRKHLEEAEAKKAELETREAELEKAIEEAETEEEKETVEKAVEEFEADKAENEEACDKFGDELKKLEDELNAEEADQTPPETSQEPEAGAKPEQREEKKVIMRRTKFFGLNVEERAAFLENDEVKSFLQRAREVIKEKRSVTGAQLLIPTVVLDLIRENITEYSKLIKHVNLQSVAGKARQTVLGVVPEAVWTEMCGKLNELNIGLTGVEVDGYKVGGFVPVCNAQLEDSDEKLAAAIIEALAKAIGMALDKAIIYGTGTKMPLGIFTRLAQTSDPSDPRTTIPWANLSTSNIQSIAAATKGASLFSAIVEATGAISSDYASGNLFFAMSHKTYVKLLSASVAFNAAGAVVAGANKEMPVVGGAIEELNFIPDDVIIGGYGELYLLAERQGGEFAQSEHVKFTEDQTVFKGTARYDGLPVIANGFVAIGINGTTPSASGITFAPDLANA